MRMLLSLRPERREEHAFVRSLDGVVTICPWRTRIRSWDAVLDVRSGVAELLADAFVPRSVAEVAEADAAAFRLEHPSARSHIRASNWTVPSRWFVLFEDAERELVLSDEERSLTYRTSMSQARRRAARALATLRRSAGEDSPVTVAVEDVARWLEEFHPRSLIELDYGGLVGVVGADQLREDHSAADIAESVQAMSDGDEAAAAAAYERIVERWRFVQLAENSN